jgi:hypothetical protein
MDDAVKKLITNVDELVKAGILLPSFEVYSNSYVCFICMSTRNKPMYCTGKMDTFPIDVQDKLLGLYLNETIDDFKVTGIYRILEGL